METKYNSTFSESDNKLMEFCIRDLLTVMRENPDLLSAKQNSSDLYDCQNKETFQIHVTIVRDEDEKLDAMQIATLSGYKPK